MFAVHGVAATLGALLTGVLASKAINAAGADGSLLQVGKQAVGVVVTLVFSGVLSFGLYKLVGAITPLRADEQDEWTGLDEAEVGERGYITADLDSAPGAGTTFGGSTRPAHPAAAAGGHPAT